jgi:hypothetical protein
VPHEHPNEPMGIGRRRTERNESGEVAELCLFNDLVDPGVYRFGPADQKWPTTRRRHMTTVALTTADRCDRCGAQAYVLLSVFVPDSGDRELCLCAHDFRQHERQLVHSGVRVILDQRRQLHKEASHA